MINISMKLFSIELQRSIEYVMRKFRDINIIKKETDYITQSEKELFLKYINDDKKNIVNKLVLQRKTRSTLSVSSSVTGRQKKIQVEVRKKRTYMHVNSALEIPKFPVQSDDHDVSLNVESKLNESILNDKLTNNPKDCMLPIKNVETHSDDSLVVIPEIQEIDAVRYKILEKSKKNFVNKNSFVENKNCLKHDKSDFIYSSNIVNVVSDTNKKSNYYFFSAEKNNNRKLVNDRKSRMRLRSKYRIGGKFIKNRKSNSNYIYNDSVTSEDTSNYKNESVHSHYRINKYKLKRDSILIQGFNKPKEIVSRNVVIGENISVLELANKMSIKSTHVINTMVQLGLKQGTVNQLLDQETAQLIAEEMGHSVLLRHVNELEQLIFNDINLDRLKNALFLKNRAPIITVMGHVDHGKTSLLDYIRSTKIADSEIGGITQSIGAYHVKTGNGMLTFLDTPGHSAFSNMRARGAQLTDIIVLVIAADDGIMPQTIEAIQHAKATKVPVVVAINKIDKVVNNFDRIKNALSKYGFVADDWGGDTQFIHVSAISGVGIDDLLEAVLLQSEMLDLKVVHNGMASGVVIDSFMDKGRGAVATVLVREGILKCGDIILCGQSYGRVRAMCDEYGYGVDSVGPSVPVELLGLSDVPNAGDTVLVVRDEKKAREVALYRQNKLREIRLTDKKESILKNFLAGVNHVHNVLVLNLIVKTDTQGSLEAVCESILNLSNNKVTVKILSSSIGSITETDIVLAKTSNAIILGFNVKLDSFIRHVIELERIDVRFYSVIYDVLDDVTKLISSLLVPKSKEKIIGVAEVRNIFCAPKRESVAGCIVKEGVIKRNKKIRIVRNNVVIYNNGELESLRRFKDDVHEVHSGIECGIGIKNYRDICIGDVIEVFDFVKEKDFCKE